MATEVIKTVKSSGGDYTTLSAWESGEQRDLVNLDEIGVAECYNDWSSGLDDPTTVSGWTVDSTRYVEIRTPASERHDGTPGTSNSRSGFTLKKTADYTKVLDLSDSYTRVIGIIFDGNDKSEPNVSLKSYCRIIKCISINGGWSDGAGYYVTNGPAYIINSLAIDCEKGFFTDAWGSTAYFYNCVAIDSDDKGFVKEEAGSGVMYCKNCISKGAANADFNFMSGLTEFDYCSSGDATSDDSSGTGNRINQTFTFVDAANDDFHLASGDAGAKDHGTDLSADANYAFSDDIDGDTRSGTWDIGIDEISAAAARRIILISKYIPSWLIIPSIFIVGAIKDLSMSRRKFFNIFNWIKEK